MSENNDYYDKRDNYGRFRPRSPLKNRDSVIETDTGCGKTTKENLRDDVDHYPVRAGRLKAAIDEAASDDGIVMLASTKVKTNEGATTCMVTLGDESEWFVPSGPLHKSSRKDVHVVSGLTYIYTGDEE